VLGLKIGLGLAFSTDLCDNNAHHKLVYNIGSKFAVVHVTTKIANGCP